MCCSEPHRLRRYDRRDHRLTHISVTARQPVQWAVLTARRRRGARSQARPAIRTHPARLSRACAARFRRYISTASWNERQHILLRAIINLLILSSKKVGVRRKRVCLVFVYILPASRQGACDFRAQIGAFLHHRSHENVILVLELERPKKQVPGRRSERAKVRTRGGWYGPRDESGV